MGVKKAYKKWSKMPGYTEEEKAFKEEVDFRHSTLKTGPQEFFAGYQAAKKKFKKVETLHEAWVELPSTISARVWDYNEQATKLRVITSISTRGRCKNKLGIIWNHFKLAEEIVSEKPKRPMSREEILEFLVHNPDVKVSTNGDGPGHNWNSPSIYLYSGDINHLSKTYRWTRDAGVTVNRFEIEEIS